MSTLTEIVRTAATKTLTDYESELEESKRRRAEESSRREMLLPSEKKQLPELPSLPEVPGIKLGDAYYPKISQEFIGQAKKRLHGVIVPAFSVHDLYTSDSDDVRHVDPDGELISSTNALCAPPGSFEEMHRAAAKAVHPINARLTMWTLPLGLALVVGCIGWLIYERTAWSIWSMLGAVVTAIMGIVFLAADDSPMKKRYTIRAKFSGLLPDEVRAKVHKVRALANGVRRERYFSGDPRILLIREVDNWGFSPAPVPNLDPLIVLSMDGDWYLIEKFDLTPVERWALEGVEG